MIRYYARSQLHRSSPYLELLGKHRCLQKGICQPARKSTSMYVFVWLGIGVHVTSHMFNLSAGVNVLWENKIRESIFNQYSGKDKQFFNSQCFSKETKLCLFRITKYTEKCFVRETFKRFTSSVKELRQREYTLSWTMPLLNFINS